MWLARPIAFFGRFAVEPPIEPAEGTVWPHEPSAASEFQCDLSLRMIRCTSSTGTDPDCD